ncbi:Uncharacterized protein dnm_005970 [Desulfonema magnum]|uniref:Uncharacterized protein n=1 Tax=Desulfonema magnum TaxID=45655 RepID=A0A975GL98_9BACT|nr:Uncharacterized protein dnm_005970 [Desulfonema magnum]
MFVSMTFSSLFYCYQWIIRFFLINNSNLPQLTKNNHNLLFLYRKDRHVKLKFISVLSGVPNL